MPTTQLATRRLGSIDVSAIGLGAMPLSVQGYDVPEDRALATVHAALDAGITLIDTADAYTANPPQHGENERLVAKALRSYDGDTPNVVVATKGGSTRLPDGGWGRNGHPDYIKQACEQSLRNLQVEAIDLYQHHRPDPGTPYADTIGAFRELVDAGKVRMVGVSNADVDQIRQAHEILGDALVSVQNQLSPSFRSSEAELDYCTERGIAFLPWSPLGGMGDARALGDRFAPFAHIAHAKGVSPQQVCLAWLLTKSPVVIPIPGSSRPETIRDSAAAVAVQLTAEEMRILDATG